MNGYNDNTPDGIPELGEYYGDYVDPRSARSQDEHWGHLQGQELTDRMMGGIPTGPYIAEDPPPFVPTPLTCGGTETTRCSSCYGEYAGCPTAARFDRPLIQPRRRTRKTETTELLIGYGFVVVLIIIGCVLIF